MTHWLIRDRGADLRIEGGFTTRTEPKASAESVAELDALLWRGLHARDLPVRRVLEAIFAELRGSHALSGSHSSHGSDFERTLAHDLRFAAFSGWLRIARVARVRGPARSVVPSVETPLLGPELAPDAWIAIELVDEDGNAVPNVAYRIECADGRVRTGTTNASGKARAEGLHYGNCHVSFPRLTGPDWKKVG